MANKPEPTKKMDKKAQPNPQAKSTSPSGTSGTQKSPSMDPKKKM